jgi:hypothetical protein
MLTNEKFVLHSTVTSRDIRIPVAGPVSQEASQSLKVTDTYFSPGVLLCSEYYALGPIDAGDLLRELEVLSAE